MVSPDSATLLSFFMADCWEPDSAVDLLRELAVQRSPDMQRIDAAKPSALRLVGGVADPCRVLRADSWQPVDERPGAASYLWVLSDDEESVASLEDLYGHTYAP